MRLQDKGIIVTACCTGIGKAIARRCVTEGAAVVIHGLQQQLGEELITDLGKNKAVLHIEDLTSGGCQQRPVELTVRSANLMPL